MKIYPILTFLIGLLNLSSIAKNKPNILFIFADDQCYETIRELGLTDIDTPNLDRLMNSGTSFTRAYNMGSWSGAVCVASRHMLNTGRFLWDAEKVSQKAEDERIAGRWWSEYMKKAGYRTYMTGKWHVRAKAENCFDVVRNLRGGMPNQTPEGYNRPLKYKPDPWSPYDPKFEGFWKGGKHWSEIVADDTLIFFDEAKKHQKSKPFFAYIAFNAPHDPRQAPKSFIDNYPLNRIKIPKSFLPEYPYKKEIKCPHNLRDERLAPMPRTKHSIKVNRQEYYAIISHMDEQIGRILDGLKASGMEKNTYVFFSADHGLGVGHHGLLGKQNLYEHSTRVPFIITGPGIPKKKTISTPIYLQDIMPSTLAIAGLKKPNHVQFKNIMPLATGKTKNPPYTEIYGAYLDAQRSITINNEKLLVYPNVPIVRVYNIKNDPFELNDIAKTKHGREITLKLFPKLIRLQQKMSDELDLSKFFPEFTEKL
jgi:choline-sulfatase